MRSLLPPVVLTGREAAMGPIPDVGQHTRAVRAEFAARDADRAQEPS